MAKLIGHIQKAILAMDIGESKEFSAGTESYTFKTSAKKVGREVKVEDTRKGWLVTRVA